MKRLIYLLAFLALIPLVGDAQTRVDRTTLFVAFDLDGEAADPDQIVTAANGDLLDSTNFVLTADPDVCRLVDMTVTDANSTISAGALTVVGTGCFGEGRTCSFTFASGGSGVKVLTCTDGEGAYFKTVTSVTTGVLTGEGGAGVDFMSLGYTSNSVNGWAINGRIKPTGPNGEQGVDPWGNFEVPKKVTTAGAASTTLAGVVATDDPFDRVSVGDTLILNVSGYVYERSVTAKASADSITLDQTVTVPAAGVTFRYKKLYYSTNPADDMSFGVVNYKALMLLWSVDANVNTGGVVTSFQCTYDYANNPGALWTVVDTATTNSGATQVPLPVSINLALFPYNRCRFGLRFGTGDDADAANEDINASIVLTQ